MSQSHLIFKPQFHLNISWENENLLNYFHRWICSWPRIITQLIAEICKINSYINKVTRTSAFLPPTDTESPKWKKTDKINSNMNNFRACESNACTTARFQGWLSSPLYNQTNAHERVNATENFMAAGNADSPSVTHVATIKNKHGNKI